MRRFITPKENNFKWNLKDCSCDILRESSLVDQFYTEETHTPDDGLPAVCFTDPLIMLFNQERLSKLGPNAVKMWLDSLSNARKSPMSELRDKLSDDDLISLVKSRHIQNPSELQAYAQWCNENVDEFNAIVAKMQEAKAAEAKAQAEKQQTPVVEPKTTE